MHLRKNKKLRLQYLNPFSIIQRIGPDVYKLQIPPPTARIHPVFHVSVLKKCYGDHQQLYVPLPRITNVESPLTQPKHVQQILISWEDLNPLNNTWEDINVITKGLSKFQPRGQG